MLPKLEFQLIIMKKLSVLLTLIMAGVACSCKKKQDNYFPSVAFEQYVYLNNPSNFDLTAPGGYIYIDGGYAGLIVYRKTLSGSPDDFIAFDRGCPQHYAEDCGKLSVSSDGIFAECDCNQEKYLMFDGSPGEGASLPLIQYRTKLNGDVLYIYN